MRRLLLTLAVCLGLSGSAWAQSWAQVDEDGTYAGGSLATVATPGVTIAAGDVAVVYVAATDTLADATITVCDDGATCAAGHVLTCGTAENFVAQSIVSRMCYILSSVASGTNSVVYTATFSEATTLRAIIVQTFSKTGTASFVAESAGDQNFGSAVSTANLTATGSDILTVAGSYNGGVPTFSAWLINGAAAGGDFGVSSTSQWWGTATSGFTGDGDVTLSGNNWWVAIAQTFSASAGGAPACTGRMLLGLVGC